MKLALGITLCVLALPALAQIQDPTRPADTPLASGLSIGANTAQGLQVIVKRPGQGRSTALISGQTVHVGSKIGEQRVVRITANEVTLQGDNGREILRLIPDVQKTPAAKPRAVTHHVKRYTTGTPKK